MAMDGVSENKNTQQTTQQTNTESFSKFADRLNATIKDQTSTIEEKKKAIDVKKQLLAHPNCPADAKKELQKEIATLNNEISQIKAMNSSVFDNKKAE